MPLAHIIDYQHEKGQNKHDFHFRIAGKRESDLAPWNNQDIQQCPVPQALPHYERCIAIKPQFEEGQ